MMNRDDVACGTSASPGAHHRRLSRRTVLRGLSVMASVLPLRRHLAAAVGQEQPGEAGVALLYQWATGALVKQSVPPSWQVHVPPQGAAFYHPPDWFVADITDPNLGDFSDGNPFGAQVVAPNDAAAVLMLNLTATAPIAAIDAAWDQIEQALGTRRVELIVEDAWDAVGLGVQAGFVAAHARGTTAAVLVQSQPDTVRGGTFLYVMLVGAVTDQFDPLAETVFLPLVQNLVTDGGSACDTDPHDDDYELDDCPGADS